MEAEKIRRLGRIEIADAEEQALSSFSRRWLKERQRQVEVLGETVKLLEPGADPDAIDEDWLLLHLDKIRLVSDKEMQFLWAKILAREANKPGSFSKRCLDFLSTLEKSEADLFTQLCQFVVHDSTEPVAAVLNFEHPIHEGLNFETLSDLNTIGLVRFSVPIHSDFGSWYDTPTVQIRYFDEQRTFRIPPSNARRIVSKVPSSPKGADYFIQYGAVALTALVLLC